MQMASQRHHGTEANLYMFQCCDASYQLVVDKDKGLTVLSSTSNYII